VAVHHVLSEAVRQAREGGGPTLVEAVTYRIEAHTNADDDTRYRHGDEVEAWRRHDPVELLERQLRELELIGDEDVESAAAAAEELAASLRERMNADPELEPMELFDHVFARRTEQLEEQAAMLRAELDAAHHGGGDAGDGGSGHGGGAEGAGR
jgi:pyruvate dehydrogenase E1 component alpha subunit